MTTTRTRWVLVKDVGAHGMETEFCAFIAKDGGMIRVMAHATHTSYVSDFTVPAAEAREVWRSKVAAGYITEEAHEAARLARRADRMARAA
jgi:hypothetical protein